MEYVIYRTLIVDDRNIDTPIAIAFTEETAKEVVESIRKARGNQLCFYKEKNQNEIL